tara:strand:- start:3357 stop:3965 length:609 start_codon:yes stop_codon:yes gene_type:complete
MNGHRKDYWGAKKMGSDSDKPKDENRVEVLDNHIYFYSEVERPKVLELNKKLRDLDIKLQKQSIGLGCELPKIYLHINSYGGSIFAGMSSSDTILTTKCDVVTIVEGCAASAGTTISIVGDERWIHKHAYMLIHQLSSGFWGKYSEIEDEKRNCDGLMSLIKGLYGEYSQVPEKQLDELLKHDLWWDAETCLKYGLVDKIIE